MAKELYAECKECEARFKIADLPVGITQLVEITKLKDGCPECGADSGRVVMCPTDGAHAVDRPRKGKLSRETKTSP